MGWIPGSFRFKCRGRCAQRPNVAAWIAYRSGVGWVRVEVFVGNMCRRVRVVAHLTGEGSRRHSHAGRQAQRRRRAGANDPVSALVCVVHVGRDGRRRSGRFKRRQASGAPKLLRTDRGRSTQPSDRSSAASRQKIDGEKALAARVFKGAGSRQRNFRITDSADAVTVAL
jgi:hypothetical protein